MNADENGIKTSACRVPANAKGGRGRPPPHEPFASDCFGGAADAVVAGDGLVDGGAAGLLAEVEFDLLEQGGEEFFFLQAGVYVFAAVHRAVAGDDDDGDLRLFFVDL